MPSASIDGILGGRTREAVRVEQQRLCLPADAWPTQQLLGSLKLRVEGKGTTASCIHSRPL
jgi:peptidoglycan hydrolase-like protein with peptidoglycan-binding domain